MKRKTILMSLWFMGMTSLAFGLTPDEQNSIKIFQEIAPSVVFITNKQQFRGFSYNPVEATRGSGSGFVWDKEGHIITNYHVVHGGNKFYVTLRDQSKHEATLIGTEVRKDLAVLKINPKKVHGKLKPIRVGTSSDLQVGQKALAIGNPFGLDHTLTVGVISALDREIEGIGGVSIREVIQTDASINPGNSGGPLLDSSGALIGMNTAIFSTTGTYSGIGFAVPVKFITKLVPQIIRYGKVTQPGLGIRVVPEEVKRMLTSIPGVMIESVAPKSAAERAGLQGMPVGPHGRTGIGDIITAIDETPISDYDDIYNAMDNYKVGDIITVTIMRNNRPVKKRVTLQKL